MPGDVQCYMTVTRRLFNRVAVCSSRLSSNNYFSVRNRDIESTNLEAGDEVRVMLIDAEVDEFKPRDRDVYSSTLQKSNQVYVPKATREKLDLEGGDLVKYLVVPTDSFPGIQDGPLRDAAQDAINGDEDDPDEEPQRPERETTNATFSAPMQKTGQVTVPANTMDKMGLVQGDQITATVEHEGDDSTFTTQIGTGNRMLIPKNEREELGLESGDEPEIRIAVFG